MKNTQSPLLLRSRLAAVICTALLALPFAPTVQADTVLSTLGGDTTPYWYTYLPGTYLDPQVPYFAQQFSTGTGTDDFEIESISFLFNESFSPEYPITVSIYSDAVSNPGSLVGSLTNLSPNPSGVTEFSATASGLLLNPSTNYWIVLYSELPENQDNLYQIGMSFLPTITQADPGWTTTQQFLVSTDGITWGAYEEENSALLFSINATAVPEPSVLGLCALVGGLGWRTLRRRMAIRR